MIALTLFGAAFTTHHAEASENKQNAANNVIDDQQNIENANVAKHQVSNAAQNISGVQTYQDPTLVKSNTTNNTYNTYTYDAKLDNLNQSASSQNNSTRSNTNDTVKNSDTISNYQSDNTKHNNNEVATTSTTSTDSTKLVTSEDSNHKLNSNRITTETPSTHNESAQVSNTHKLNTDEPKTTLNNVENQNNSISKAQLSTTVVNNKQQKVEDNATTTNNDNNKVSLSSTTESDSTSKNLSNTSDNTTVNNEDTTLKKNNTQTSPMHNTLKVRAYSTALNNTHVNNKATTSTQSNDASVSDSTSSVHKGIGGKGGPATVSTYSTTSSLPKYVPQVKSSINNYIRTNNLKAPSIEEHYTSYFPKYGYRNGVGKPEGIVVHDTANDNSTIEGEINYMRNNYTNAFVHAFVDGNRIIETAPTDYLSWGAGPYGNNRFINVEIVHTHDYASFARSMNNYADYAATQLQYYGLKPDSAEYDAKGTVWTHYAISRYLGGTDHADPHAYLSNHNYSYDELYDLINEKYLIKMGKVAPWGTTSTNNSTPTTKPSINNKN